MFKQVRYFFSQLRRVRSIDKKRTHLDYLLDSLDPLWPLTEKIEWLIKLMQWIRIEEQNDLNLLREAGRQPEVRVLFIITLLNRRPDWKIKVAKTLREVITSINGMQLFCETGLAKETTIVSEVKERLLYKFLPEAPLEEELTYLIAALFPYESDALWLQKIDDSLAQEIIELVTYECDSSDRWNNLYESLESALVYLAIQVRALGTNPMIRHRTRTQHLRSSSFYLLSNLIENFLKIRTADPQAVNVAPVLAMINSAHIELDEVYKHLNESGVSVQIVFQIRILKEYLNRIKVLLLILSSTSVPAKLVVDLCAKLVADVSEMRSLRKLWSQNSALLSQKIVERTAATGEHYITRTTAEYIDMLRAASGGGAVTALTVFIKVLVTSIGFSSLITGVLASVNYAVSFVGIHLLGFTLGTKQPAMTAPALADKIEKLDESGSGINSLVEDIVCIIRSQVASVLGNVLLVVPVVIALTMISFSVFGFHLMPEVKAYNAFEEFDFLSMAPIYAAFTGILLWLSSLISGWADNWFAFRGLRRRIIKNRTLNKAFGLGGARKIAIFFQDNIAAFAGNISLGFLLGLTPELLKFIGIPLDIRHITLSAGTLAAALPVVGWEAIREPEFVRSLVGLFFIGAFNVGVSFSLALWVAIKARNI
ncbi:MAG: hypothetical protein ACLGGX_12720, partial [Bdellovibrionia bacterium]